MTLSTPYQFCICYSMDYCPHNFWKPIIIRNNKENLYCTCIHLIRCSKRMKRRKQKKINRRKREHQENKRNKLLKSCLKHMKFQFVFKSVHGATIPNEWFPLRCRTNSLSLHKMYQPQLKNHHLRLNNISIQSAQSISSVWICCYGKFPDKIVHWKQRKTTSCNTHAWLFSINNKQYCLHILLNVHRYPTQH